MRRLVNAIECRRKGLSAELTASFLIRPMGEAELLHKAFFPFSFFNGENSGTPAVLEKVSFIFVSEWAFSRFSIPPPVAMVVKKVVT